jgi:hypothetical protein
VAYTLLNLCHLASGVVVERASPRMQIQGHDRSTQHRRTPVIHHLVGRPSGGPSFPPSR